MVFSERNTYFSHCVLEVRRSDWWATTCLRKVLIVEDDGTSRKILRGILLNIGFIEIEEVESGEAALTNLQENHDWARPS